MSLSTPGKNFNTRIVVVVFFLHELLFNQRKEL